MYPEQGTAEEMGLVAPRLRRAHYPPLVPVMLKTRQILLFVATLSLSVYVRSHVCVCTIQSAPHMQSDRQPIWYASYSTLNQSQGSRLAGGGGGGWKMCKIFWLIYLVCILKDFHCMICTTVTIAINQGTTTTILSTLPCVCVCVCAGGGVQGVAQCAFRCLFGTLSSPLTGLRARRKAYSNKTSVVSLFQLRPQHISYSIR